jgi:hypothetical protein
MEFELQCMFCDAKSVVDADSGRWVSMYDFPRAVGDAFCPDHALAQEWFDAQCSGCVGGFPGCSFSAVMEGVAPLAQEWMDSVVSGVCPNRTNGTMRFDTARPELGMLHLDLSKVSTVGIAVLDAVQDYRRVYERYLREEK